MNGRNAKGGPLHSFLIFSSVFAFKKLLLVCYVEMKMSRVSPCFQSCVLYVFSVCFESGASPKRLHDDDDEYHSNVLLYDFWDV
jgi:hypothetical protein